MDRRLTPRGQAEPPRRRCVGRGGDRGVMSPVQARAGDHDVSSATSAALTPYRAPGRLMRARDDGRIECVACAHRCALIDGAAGRCGVRSRLGDDLLVPFGYVAARRVRAVETNTIYHVSPGSLALTFGMYGCDLRCPYCHNARLSQALREPDAEISPKPITAAALADEAVAEGCGVVCSAYNEPMITAEWAHAVFEEAHRPA